MVTSIVGKDFAIVLHRVSYGKELQVHGPAKVVGVQFDGLLSEGIFREFDSTRISYVVDPVRTCAMPNQRFSKKCQEAKQTQNWFSPAIRVGKTICFCPLKPSI